MENNYKYCNQFNQYIRFKTREVNIGNLKLGGNNPIRIQSMTNTDTLNTQKSVEQCIRIFDAGADLVRLTAQTTKHAENLANIRKELSARGYDGPLVADIHFNPKVAEAAAEIVEKVRVNPGNFVDRKGGPAIETEEQYQEELGRIEEQFTRLINICKANKTAMRIGSNHGSLSGRIVNRYGDTVEGMAQSVLEFLRIAVKNDFHEIVISLKASNTRVMVYAYRLMMHKMIEAGMNYPLHLGVTEAGDGEDGRIKSAIGIGTLLADGLGDTVRVSLTEDPEKEVPVAKKIIAYFQERSKHEPVNGPDQLVKNPFEYLKRQTSDTTEIGSSKKAVAIADLSNQASIVNSDILKLGFKLGTDGKWINGSASPDYIYTGQALISIDNQPGIKLISDASDWEDTKNIFPFFADIQGFIDANRKSSKMNFLNISNCAENIEKLNLIRNDSTVVLLLESKNENPVADMRAFMQHLIINKIDFPVILKVKYEEPDFESFQIKSACDTGPLFIDGYADGILLMNPAEKDTKNVIKTAFGILQASRTRMTKTEFISCPSCGRTLFEIQSVTEKLKKRTGHLKGLKLAVMGCIVNGPGEMADADYGYVGAGSGRVSLYKGKEVVKKNIPSENAIEELIQLIKEKGDWKDPENN